MLTEDSVSRVRHEAGWIALDRLGLIRVAGPQRVKFLHNLLSNDIAGLVSGKSRLAALMNLKGQQVAWMRVLAESDALFCELPLTVRQTVIDTFIHYKVGAPVRFETPDTRVLGLFGAQAADVLRSLGVDEPPAEVDTFVTMSLFGGNVRVSRGSDMPARGFTLHVDSAMADALATKLHESLGARISVETLDSLRVEEGIAWHGIDVAEENLLHETGQLAVYHSSSKGCYLGQEVVARLEGRGGNVNKRFRGFRSAEPLPAGAEITADEKVIGRTTTTGSSKAFGSIAMGYVHRSHSDPGTRVRIAGYDAEVVTLPFIP